jgi:hypothetical protein
MITVEQAKEMSDKVAKGIIDKEIQKIEKVIKNTAKKGRYSITYECKACYCVRVAIRDMLKEFGYQAYVDSFYPEIKIIWSKKE